MKLKLSIIAAALAAGFAGNAGAAIATGNGVNDQLFLSVWDPVAQVSYTRGLGLTGANMIANAGISFGASNTGSGFTAAGDTTSYSLAPDLNLNSFLATYAADAASMQWNVVGGDGWTTYGTKGLYVTAAGSMPTGWSTSYFGGMQAFSGAYLQGVNNAMPAGSVVGNTDSIIATAATGANAYAAAQIAYFNNNLGNGLLSLNDAAGLGQNMNFYMLNPTLTTGSRPTWNGAPVIYQFANAGGASKWTLGSNGTLTYQVASVPEPGELGLMLGGFGLVGFLANKRRKAALKA